MALYSHHHLFEGGVARALAQTVDRDLHLTRAILHGGQRVGRRHAQVIVAVGRDDGLVDVGNVVHQVGYLRAVLARQTVTRGVGYVHYRRARRYDGLHHAGEELLVGAARILGIELHVVDEAARVFYRLDGVFENRFGRHAQLLVNMIGRGAYSRVDTSALRELQRLGCHVDVFLHGASERAYHGARHGLRDLHHRIEIARARYGESGLDYVHSEFFELSGHFDLLDGVELTTRDLLGVAERGVENVYFFAHVLRVMNPSVGRRRGMRPIGGIDW